MSEEPMEDETNENDDMRVSQTKAKHPRQRLVNITIPRVTLDMAERSNTSETSSPCRDDGTSNRQVAISSVAAALMGIAAIVAGCYMTLNGYGKQGGFLIALAFLLAFCI